MARRIIAFVLAAAWLVLGLGALPGSGLHGSAYAQDAAKKIKSIEANVKAARESAETDKLVEGYCNMAWAGIKNIRKNYSSDKSAMDAAAKALEACNFEIPVAYFGKRLDATRCDTFITKARNYFEGFGVFALRDIRQGQAGAAEAVGGDPFALRGGAFRARHQGLSRAGQSAGVWIGPAVRKRPATGRLRAGIQDRVQRRALEELGEANRSLVGCRLGRGRERQIKCACVPNNLVESHGDQQKSFR